MFDFVFKLRLSTKKDALVASMATFILTAFFFVTALMLFPAVRG
ncbi:MAG: hypothetical protein WC840_03750 [Candidatus Peribacteraceae bacterium]